MQSMACEKECKSSDSLAIVNEPSCDVKVDNVINMLPTDDVEEGEITDDAEDGMVPSPGNQIADASLSKGKHNKLSKVKESEKRPKIRKDRGERSKKKKEREFERDSRSSRKRDRFKDSGGQRKKKPKFDEPLSPPRPYPSDFINSSDMMSYMYASYDPYGSMMMPLASQEDGELSSLSEAGDHEVENKTMLSMVDEMGVDMDLAVAGREKVGSFKDPEKRRKVKSSRNDRRSEDRRKRSDRHFEKEPLEICRHFYKKGFCDRGESCRFKHIRDKPWGDEPRTVTKPKTDVVNLDRVSYDVNDLPNVLKTELCKYFLEGQCHRGGEACPYLHLVYPCKFYHTGSKCFAADNCKFSHDPLTEQTRPLLDKALGRIKDKIPMPPPANRQRRRECLKKGNTGSTNYKSDNQNEYFTDDLGLVNSQSDSDEVRPMSILDITPTPSSDFLKKVNRSIANDNQDNGSNFQYDPGHVQSQSGIGQFHHHGKRVHSHDSDFTDDQLSVDNFGQNPHQRGNSDRNQGSLFQQNQNVFPKSNTMDLLNDLVGNKIVGSSHDHSENQFSQMPSQGFPQLFQNPMTQPEGIKRLQRQQDECGGKLLEKKSCNQDVNYRHHVQITPRLHNNSEQKINIMDNEIENCEATPTFEDEDDNELRIDTDEPAVVSHNTEHIKSLGLPSSTKKVITSITNTEDDDKWYSSDDDPVDLPHQQKSEPIMAEVQKAEKSPAIIKDTKTSLLQTILAKARQASSGKPPTEQTQKKKFDEPTIDNMQSFNTPLTPVTILIHQPPETIKWYYPKSLDVCQSRQLKLDHSCKEKLDKVSGKPLDPRLNQKNELSIYFKIEYCILNFSELSLKPLSPIKEIPLEHDSNPIPVPTASVFSPGTVRQQREVDTHTPMLGNQPIQNQQFDQRQSHNLHFPFRQPVSSAPIVGGGQPNYQRHQNMDQYQNNGHRRMAPLLNNNQCLLPRLSVSNMQSGMIQRMGPPHQRPQLYQPNGMPPTGMIHQLPPNAIQPPNFPNAFDSRSPPQMQLGNCNDMSLKTDPRLNRRVHSQTVGMNPNIPPMSVGHQQFHNNFNNQHSGEHQVPNTFNQQDNSNSMSVKAMFETIDPNASPFVM